MRKHPIWDSLSESKKAKYGRIVDWYINISVLAGMCGTFYVVTNIWHWPFLLALTLGSALGTLLGLVAVTAPLWGILLLAAVYGRRTPPALDPDKE